MGVTKTISLEDAMLMTGFGKYNLYVFTLSGVILVGMICETLGLSYIIPAAQCDLELSLTQKGWLAAIPFIGIIATSHLWGWLADTRGRKPVIKWSIAIGSLLSIASSFCPNLLSFALFRMVAALFIAGPAAVVYAYLGEFHTAKYRDRMVIFLSAFLVLASVLLPGVAWLVYPLDFRYNIDIFGVVYRPWRLLVVICAMPYFICTAFINSAPESPKFLASVGKTDEALEVLKTFYLKNTGANDDPFQHLRLENTHVITKDESLLKSMWNQTAPLFRKPLLFYTSIACTGQFITFSNVNGFYLWIPEILNKLISRMEETGAGGTICEVLSFRPNITDNLTMTYECNDTVHTETFIRSLILGAIYCPFPALSALLVDILGKRNILVYTPMLCGLCSLAIYWSTNEYLSLVLLAIMQMDSVCIGMMNAVVVELISTNFRAMAVSLSLLTARIGSIMGSNLIGYLIEYNCSLCFFLYAALLLINSGISLLLPNDRKNKAVELCNT